MINRLEIVAIQKQRSLAAVPKNFMNNAYKQCISMPGVLIYKSIDAVFECFY